MENVKEFLRDNPNISAGGLAVLMTVLSVLPFHSSHGFDRPHAILQMLLIFSAASTVIGAISRQKTALLCLGAIGSLFDVLGLFVSKTMFVALLGEVLFSPLAFFFFARQIVTALLLEAAENDQA